MLLPLLNFQALALPRSLCLRWLNNYCHYCSRSKLCKLNFKSKIKAIYCHTSIISLWLLFEFPRPEPPTRTLLWLAKPPHHANPPPLPSQRTHAQRSPIPLGVRLSNRAYGPRHGLQGKAAGGSFAGGGGGENHSNHAYALPAGFRLGDWLAVIQPVR